MTATNTTVTETADDSVPSFQSPVLAQVYPALLEYKRQYGHPNIPLGSSEGRLCKTLRRLHIQDKLSEVEIEWLQDLGFAFHSLEDVYFDVDFDDLLSRLLQFEAQYKVNFQVPKKCKEDPELGAWVTGIRRLHKLKEGRSLQADHVAKLNEIGFAWESTRKCGSKFMKQYREIAAQMEGTAAADDVMRQHADWVQAQQKTCQRGGLSSTRVQYMEQLLEPVLESGQSWLEWNLDEETQ